MLNYGPVSRSADSSERTAAASRQQQRGDSRLGSNAAQRQLVRPPPPPPPPHHPSPHHPPQPPQLGSEQARALPADDTRRPTTRESSLKSVASRIYPRPVLPASPRPTRAAHRPAANRRHLSNPSHYTPILHDPSKRSKSQHVNALPLFRPAFRAAPERTSARSGCASAGAASLGRGGPPATVQQVGTALCRLARSLLPLGGQPDLSCLCPGCRPALRARVNGFLLHGCVRAD